jgi:hypothetical protein
VSGEARPYNERPIFFDTLLSGAARLARFPATLALCLGSPWDPSRFAAPAVVWGLPSASETMHPCHAAHGWPWHELSMARMGRVKGGSACMTEPGTGCVAEGTGIFRNYSVFIHHAFE